MINRQGLEEREYIILSDKAAKAAETRGRARAEKKCSVRTDFQRDRDRIIHSKAFRRLMHKTQVFLAPEDDHLRTRLTHTLEVSQIARTVARILMLNEDLTEAIALGHDLGHTPFGHSGEAILDSIHKGGFHHNIQSLRVVDVLEENQGRRGMNLTAEVRDGILNHTGPDRPFTLEGQIVKICDRIAYVNHDIDDAIRGHVIRPEDLPRDCISALGSDHRTRINTLVNDLASNSDGADEINLSSKCALYMDKLRTYMFENVYKSTIVKRVEDLEKTKKIIESLYRYYQENPNQLPQDHYRLVEDYGTDEAVKDYVAGMTDRYAINLYNEIFVPKWWM